jgi:hypothetical protein
MMFFLLFGERLQIGWELVMLFQLMCDIMHYNLVVAIYLKKRLTNILWQVGWFVVGLFGKNEIKGFLLKRTVDGIAY